MLKKVIDTNIFIDRFLNPSLFKDIFLSDGLIYMSSVVLMEFKSGAHTKESLKAVNNLSSYFKRVYRIVTPVTKDYEHAGEMIAKLQTAKGYNIKNQPQLQTIV